MHDLWGLGVLGVYQADEEPYGILRVFTTVFVVQVTIRNHAPLCNPSNKPSFGATTRDTLGLEKSVLRGVERDHI